MLRFFIAFLLPFALNLSNGSSAADYPSLSVKVIPIEVTPRVFYVQGQPGVASSANEGYNSNAGFVITDDGVVVIDALGTPALGDAFLKEQRARDLFPWVDENTAIVRADRWLERDEAFVLKPRIMVTGHGAVSREPVRDLALTRD